MSDPFVGQIMWFGFNFAPRGWAQCNGQLLPISQNTALFSLLGTYYGGDGRTNFALPNLNGVQNVAVAGIGDGPGLTSRSLGEIDGADSVTLLANQLPAHNHLMALYSGVTGATGVPQTGYVLADPGANTFVASTATPASTLAGSAVALTGGNLPHNNDQPALAVNFCIATQGIYPPRN